MAAWRPFANGKRDRGEPDDAGYYSLQESPGDPWAARLEEIDRYLDAEREKPKRKHSRWWWFSRGVAALLALFILLVAWLAVTAPLSKSLQPIARNGAEIEAPVEVEELPPHVVEALLAIEDRRFYNHWGIDPRGIARAVWGNLTSDRTQGASTIT